MFYFSKQEIMESFSDLYHRLDMTNSTNDKVDRLEEYFSTAAEDDKIFALALLCGRRPKRTIQVSFLRKWAAEIAQLPDWLFEESYHTVGDLAETISMLVRAKASRSVLSLCEQMQALKALEKADEAEKKDFIISSWQNMNQKECFVFNKLITGGFRVGVSQKLVEKALARVLKKDVSQIAHQLAGDWSPFDIEFKTLFSEESLRLQPSKPYPFYLAYSIEPMELQQWNPDEWQVEWKWDGIRAQLIIREGQLFLWSRGEEVITDRFPELNELLAHLPGGTVIDGELVCLNEEGILPFQYLQTRIGRKNLTKKMLASFPAGIIAYDILEYQGIDIRQRSLEERRLLLESIISPKMRPIIQLSELINYQSWEELGEIRKQARIVRSEGLMIKRKDSAYQSGRKRGDWWKWKLDPMSIDAVMIYAMKGHGRRANLYTDYTFAVWQDTHTLVPFTKAYSGLTDAEIKEVDAFVRKYTMDKFGPVRSVKPELVFEIGFEGIQESTRHKSGIALRFPRMLRWRKDKKASEADTIETLRSLLDAYKASGKG
jgi:DNA ligase-1